ncbi:hypothetical protein BGZ82_009553 [Podila clonocystis]|nr:hypothetical protein BGZ82_009553 [Podila clonocystis]
METIYGIQSDTASLREAHERQKRISQQRLQEQKSTLGNDRSSHSSSKPVAAAMPLKGPPKASLIARSTSASALPSRAQQQHHSQLSELQKHQQQQGPLHQRSALEDEHSGPVSSSFLSILDKHPTATNPHGSHLGTPSYQLPSTQPPLIKSANQSPAFFPKRLYDSEHRMPWLALPGSAAGLGGAASTGEKSPSLFMGRRRSDAGLGGGGGKPTTTATPTGGILGNSDGFGHGSLPVQENISNNARSPHTPHHHHQHLLSQQDIVQFSRHGSPMPLSEALPHYLRAGHRKKSVESFHQPNNTSSTSLSTSAMERSFSSPNAGVIHTAPASPFMIPISTAAGLAAVANASSGGHTPTLRSTTASGVNSLAGSGANTPALVGHGGSSSYHHTSPSHLLFAFPGSHTPRPEIERGVSAGPLPVSRSGWLDAHAHGYATSGSTTPLGGQGVGAAAMGSGLGSMGSRLHPSSGTTASNSKEVHA